MWYPWQVFRWEHPKRRTPGGIGWWPSGRNDVLLRSHLQATRKPLAPACRIVQDPPQIDLSRKAKSCEGQGTWKMPGHWKLSPSPGPLMSNRSRSPWSLADLWFGIKSGFGLEGNKEPAPLSPLRGAPQSYVLAVFFTVLLVLFMVQKSCTSWIW